MPARFNPFVALLGCVMLVGCATGGARVASSDAHVQVDSVPVAVAGNPTLLELLRRATFAGRLGEDAPPQDRPLVVIDGVIQLDGTAALASIPALQVGSVTTMRGARAVALYGPKAAAGAIVVRTRGREGVRLSPRP
jgi:hypothetical protein